LGSAPFRKAGAETPLTPAKASALLDRVVLATRNEGKAVELERQLRGIARTIESLRAYPDVTLPPEGDRSYAENALAKARAAAAALGIPAIGDDSGLEVDALAGAPGIRSARYAGEDADDARNNALLLRNLEGIPPERRTARFRCALALAGAGAEVVVDGTCAGRILEAERGGRGFGYDPLFVPDGEARSFGELSHAEKDRVSHRARAAAALIQEAGRR
jgi:XTP/dITP diphosphohydrolase